MPWLLVILLPTHPSSLPGHRTGQAEEYLVRQSNALHGMYEENQLPAYVGARYRPKDPPLYVVGNLPLLLRASQGGRNPQLQQQLHASTIHQKSIIHPCGTSSKFYHLHTYNGGPAQLLDARDALCGLVADQPGGMYRQSCVHMNGGNIPKGTSVFALAEKYLLRCCLRKVVSRGKASMQRLKPIRRRLGLRARL